MAKNSEGLEEEVSAFLEELEKSGMDNKKKFEAIFSKYTNSRLDIALTQLRKQLEEDLKKYKH